MTSEWLKVRVEEIGAVKSGKRLPLGHVLTGLPTDFPYIRLVDVDNGRVRRHDIRFLNVETRERIKKYVVNTGDVCLAIVGHTIGMVFYIESNFDNVNLTENAARITGFKECINSKYLYYYLSSPVGQAAIQARKIGSAQGKLPLYNIKSLEITAPPRKSQDDIVALLNSLEERITLLRETNATLEAIAQALFKSWFVDFEPVRAKMEGREPEGMDTETAALFPDRLEESELGLVPKGWRVLTIGDVIETAGGATPDTKNALFWDFGVHCWTTPKDLSGISSPVLLNTERKLSELGLAKVGSGLLPAGTLLLSSRAPIGYLALAQIPLAINQGYIAMLPGGLLPPVYMLLWCQANMEIIKSRANGSTFMEISKKAFRPIPVLVPPVEIIEDFTKISGRLMDKLVMSEKQAKTLCALRDALLPRLISGQLRLPDAEAQIEAIAA